ncbi:MAG: hypothetical protein QMC81_08460 [Thermoanaerobacterales bacterium]|nr:hypothetical protein [Thermoanaerobacterales bacterium]
MVIDTETTVALRCPECGRLGLFTLDRFSFSREKTQEVLCGCGAALMIVTGKKHRSYWLEINCAICEATHLYRLSPRECWGPDVVHLSCQETDIEMGHVGPREKVKACLPSHEEALEALVAEMGGKDYFHNAEIMLAALTYVHTLAEEGNMSCACGENRIELEIHPDRVELHCRHCRRVYVIEAATDEDLVRLESAERIELSRHVTPRPGGGARYGHDKKGDLNCPS